MGLGSAGRSLPTGADGTNHPRGPGRRRCGDAGAETLPRLQGAEPKTRGHLAAHVGARSGAWPPPGVPHAGSEPRLPPALPPPCGPFCPARAGCSLGLDGPGTLEVSAQMPSPGSPFPACVCRSSDTSPGTTGYTFTFIYQGLRSPCDLFDILPIVSPLK